eukprot:scaffold278461_cov22-Attheya_sp.AAC.1
MFLHRAVIRYRCDQMGTPVTIKDPEAVEKSMISGHFNPVEAWCRASNMNRLSTAYANSS